MHVPRRFRRLQITELIDGNWKEITSTSLVKGRNLVTFIPSTSTITWRILGPFYVKVNTVCITQPVLSQQSVLVDICNTDKDKYRFGFNGQEKVNEWAGIGNHNTAEFWEYDTRTGRRYEQAPKPNPSISNYAAFANNPIWYSDVHGDTIGVNSFKSTEKSKALQNEAKDLSNGVDDGVFIVAGHGSSVHMSYELDGKTGNIFNADEFNDVMSAKSKEWQERMKDGKDVVVILYACNTGSNEYYDSHFYNRTERVNKSLAQKISEKFTNVTVVAPDKYVFAGADPKTGKTKIYGVQQTTDKEHKNTMQGGFVIFKHGKKVAKQVQAYDPDTRKTKVKPKEKL